MKTGIMTLMIAVLTACSIRAGAQQYNEYGNVNNQYGPPTFTGGTAPTPSESFARAYRSAGTVKGPTLIETVYPNPARGSSNIVLADIAVNPVVIYVIDMNGTIMRTYSYDGGYDHFSFDVSSLQDGLYSIQVQEQGKSVQSVKLLKQS